MLDLSIKRLQKRNAKLLLSGYLNPNMAGLFEGSFSWEGGGSI